MTLTASIAERIGAKPKRALVVGGFPNFVERTFRRKAAAWGLLIEWHWKMGARPREIRIPAGCEVVVYFSDMVDVPATWGPALKAACGPGVLLIHTVRKAAIWQKDFARAGLREDHLHPLKEPPEMPPPAPTTPPKPVTSIPPPPPPDAQGHHRRDGVAAGRAFGDPGQGRPGARQRRGTPRPGRGRHQARRGRRGEAEGAGRAPRAAGAVA